MLSNLHQLVKQHKEEIVLFTAIVLISLLSFAVGFIAAKMQEREPLRVIETENTETQ